MNLLRTLAAVSGMTLLSRITGLIREFLFARYFGVSAYTDAFFIAFRIPNLLRRLFAEGAFSQAFVPILAEYKTTHGVVEAKRLIDHVWTVLAWFLLLLSVLGVLGAAYVVYAMAAGLSSNAGAFSAAVLMTRVMFPYILCMSLVAFASGVLNTWGHFRIPAFTPVLLNVSLIVAMLFFCRYLAQPIYGLAFAVLFGGFLQLGLQLWALRRIFLLPRLSFNVRAAWKDPGVKRVIKQMLPATFAVSVAQLSLMINTLIASYLPHGSVSWLSYADRLMEFPTALLGVALGTILLPSLSKAYSDADHSEYSQLLDWGLRLTFLLALPAALMMIILALPMTAVLFHYGQFTAHDALMTQHALIAYGIGLIGLILVKILAPGFYAQQNIKTPVKIAIGVLIVTQLFNAMFVPWIQHAGLALSIGLGACLNAGFLYWKLRKRGLYHPVKGWLSFLLRLSVALLLLGLTAYGLMIQVDWLSLKTAPMYRACLFSGVAASCALVYLCALYLMGFRLADVRRITNAK